MTEVNCPFKCIMFTIYLNYLVFLLKMTLLKRHTLPPMVKMRAEMEFVCKRSMKSLHLSEVTLPDLFPAMILVVCRNKVQA